MPAAWGRCGEGWGRRVVGGGVAWSCMGMGSPRTPSGVDAPFAASLLVKLHFLHFLISGVTGAEILPASPRSAAARGAWHSWVWGVSPPTPWPRASSGAGHRPTRPHLRTPVPLPPADNVMKPRRDLDTVS